MKKFKNKIAIEGSESLRKAFVEELKLLGYKESYAISERYDDWKKYPILCTQYNPGNNDYGNFDKGFKSFSKYTLYTLPTQWNEALAAASEVEEEIPEYVKCTYSYSSNFIEGNIYKVISWDTTGWSLYNENGTTTSGQFKPNYSKFEISIKAAYDAQQQELADKELLEKLIKESGFKVGDYIQGLCIPYNSGEIKEFLLEHYPNKEKEEKVLHAKLTSGEKVIFFNWYGKSMYKKVPKIKILTLGSSNIEIKISKGKIEATGREFNISWVKAVLGKMRGGLCGDFSYCYPTIKIGCSTFTLAELEQIVETYNELNK